MAASIRLSDTERLFKVYGDLMWEKPHKRMSAYEMSEDNIYTNVCQYTECLSPSVSSTSTANKHVGFQQMDFNDFMIPHWQLIFSRTGEIYVNRNICELGNRNRVLWNDAFGTGKKNSKRPRLGKPKSWLQIMFPSQWLRRHTHAAIHLLFFVRF